MVYFIRNYCSQKIHSFRSTRDRFVLDSALLRIYANRRIRRVITRFSIVRSAIRRLRGRHCQPPPGDDVRLIIGPATVFQVQSAGGRPPRELDAAR